MRKITLYIDALDNIIDYLHDDEKKNWEESGKPKDHIYRYLLQAEDLLDRMRRGQDCLFNHDHIENPNDCEFGSR